MLNKFKSFEIKQKLAAFGQFILRPKSLIAFIVILLVASVMIFYQVYTLETKFKSEEFNKNRLEQELSQTKEQLTSLKNDDQYQKNEKLQEEIENINQSYKKAATFFEQINDLKSKAQKVESLDILYAKVVKLLSDKNYQEAEKEITILEKQITDANQKNQQSIQTAAAKAQVVTSQSSPNAASVTGAANNNTLPASGYQRQRVKTDLGEFVLDIVAADLNSTKVIIDTSSDSDCHDNCTLVGRI